LVFHLKVKKELRIPKRKKAGFDDISILYYPQRQRNCVLGNQSQQKQ
jgi:hypothetical protein